MREEGGGPFFAAYPHTPVRVDGVVRAEGKLLHPCAPQLRQIDAVERQPHPRVAKIEFP